MRRASFLLTRILVLSIGLSSSVSWPVYGAEKEKTIRWAADSESGAPYAFQDPKDPTLLKGFEVDIIEAVAKKIGRKPVFVQNSWDGLIPGLNRDTYDVVINGIEITDDRKAEILFSTPYCLTHEQIIVRANQEGITTMADFKGRIVGTLKTSLAQRMLEAEPGIEVRTYEEETNALEDLRNQRLDAVFFDAPIALYYAKPDTTLKLVGAPVGELSYGIGLRKKDRALLNEVNRALLELRQDGTLRAIYERWGLWNPIMAKAFQDLSPSTGQPTAYDDFMGARGGHDTVTEKLKLYWSFMPLLMKGAWTTLEISVLSMILAVSFGLFLALCRMYGPWIVRGSATLWIELIRGTPLLIQLFFIFYALPHLGIKLTPFFAAVLGLGLNYAAYEAENYRAGLQSVPRGQTEAGLALGLDPLQTVRHIVLPQAVRNVIPPITNDFISLLKDSSLVSVITMVELTKVYGQLASTYYDYLGTGVLVAMIYFLLGLPFVRLAKTVEAKFSIHHKGR